MNMQIPAIFSPLYTERKRAKLLHGGRGSAKTETVARYFLTEGLQQNHRFLCTREIQKTIASSTHQTLKDVISEFNLPYLVQEAKIKSLINSTEFIFTGLKGSNTQNIKSIKGITKVWVEEAQTVTEGSLVILVPSIREPGSELIFTMNRTDENDPVWVKYGKNPDENTLVIKANYYDNPFFPDVLRMEMEKSRREDSAEDFAHIWLGEPFKQTKSAAIPMQLISDAMNRTLVAEGPVEVGIDVARGGGDATCVYKRHGPKLIGKWKTKKELDPEEIIAEVEGLPGPPLDFVRVDDTGLGWALTLALQKRYGKSKVQAINFASKEGIDKKKYPNITTHMYFEFRDMLPHLQLDHDLELMKELSSRRYHYNNPLKVRQVESKEEFKKRLGHSPDDSDALLLCFVGRPKREFRYSIS